MNKNRLLELLRAGKVVLGFSNTLAAPGILEAIGPGYDFVWIDAQHGTHTVETVRQAVREAEGIGTEAVVRVPGHEVGIIGPYLDTGVTGVIVPMVSTAEEATAIVRAARFPPLGQRSYGGRRMWDVYGTDYYREREPLIVAQIESQEGLRNAPSIIGTPGIDVLFLGSVDLAIDMGLLPERWGESRQCLPDIARIARDAAKFAGCVAGSVEALTAAVEAGCQFISFGDETGFLQSAARARLQQARTALSEEILGDASSRQNDREGDSSLRSE